MSGESVPWTVVRPFYIDRDLNWTFVPTFFERSLFGRDFNQLKHRVRSKHSYIYLRKRNCRVTLFASGNPIVRTTRKFGLSNEFSRLHVSRGPNRFEARGEMTRSVNIVEWIGNVSGAIMIRFDATCYKVDLYIFFPINWTWVNELGKGTGFAQFARTDDPVSKNQLYRK